jgi:hypothetical protein
MRTPAGAGQAGVPALVQFLSALPFFLLPFCCLAAVFTRQLSPISSAPFPYPIISSFRMLSLSVQSISISIGSRP